MFSTGSVVVSNSSRARSMRASASHAIGGTPVSSRNRRVSVRRDMWACLASVSRSSGSARFSSIQSRSGPSWSPLASGRNRSTNCACPPCRCGGATSARARLLAAAAPWSRRMMWRHRSIPVVTPADVRISPSSTNKRFGTHPRGGSGAAARRPIASASWRGARRGFRRRRERRLRCRSIRGGRRAHAPPAGRQGRPSTPLRRRPHSPGRSRSRLGREHRVRLTC